VPEKHRKTKINQKDAGIEGLFGSNKPDFQEKNQNLISGLSKPSNKKWQPVLTGKTAEQRKREELYGKSAALSGGKKGDS
jgi:hypothetical protein